MANRFMLLGLVVLASSFCSVGQAQSVSMPSVAPNHNSPHDSYSNVYAGYCIYDWGISFNCRYLTGYKDLTGDYIDLYQQRVDTVRQIYAARTLTCRVKAGAWRASNNSAAIPAIALDTSSSDCSTGGYFTTCSESGCETGDWAFFGIITLEGSWSNPETISQGNSIGNTVDNVNGVRSHSVCHEDTSSRFMVGGWSFLGNYYPVGDWYSDEGSPTASGYAQRYDRKCTSTVGP